MGQNRAQFYCSALIYLRVYTELADEVELLAAVRCGFPLETRMPQNISTSFFCIWHIHPVAVADIWAIQPRKGTWEKLIYLLQLNWLSAYFLFFEALFCIPAQSCRGILSLRGPSLYLFLSAKLIGLRCNLGIIKQQSNRLCWCQGERGGRLFLSLCVKIETHL